MLIDNEAKTSWPALIIIFIIAILIGGGIYYWQSNQKAEEPVQITVSPTTTPTVSPTATGTPTTQKETDEIINWKTYINKSFGFSFKYPDSYIAEETEKIKGAGKIGGTFVLKDNSREGNPEMKILFNPDGFGPGIQDLYYCTKIENGRLKIISSKKFNTAGMKEGPDLKKKIVIFDIGHYQSINGFDNGIIVIFKYDKNGPNYELELKKIIGTIKITKENIYGENDCY